MANHNSISNFGYKKNILGKESLSEESYTPETCGKSLQY